LYQRLPGGTSSLIYAISNLEGTSWLWSRNISLGR